MSKFNKLKKRFLSKPKDFTFDELNTLLTGLGYSLSNKGKTSGSAVEFFNGKQVIRIHKPHPGNELKHYQIASIADFLKEELK